MRHSLWWGWENISDTTHNSSLTDKLQSQKAKVQVQYNCKECNSKLPNPHPQTIFQALFCFQFCSAYFWHRVCPIFFANAFIVYPISWSCHNYSENSFWRCEGSTVKILHLASMSLPQRVNQFFLVVMVVQKKLHSCFFNISNQQLG